MHIIHKESLDGFDRELETLRQEKFELFQKAKDKPAQRSALEALASLTSLRSPAFVADYDRALGIGVNNE